MAFISGANGNDTISPSLVTAGVTGGPVTNTGDSIFAYGGDDVITGGNGSDNLVGSGGNDTINGGNGDDRISGADGNDIINGGAGNDHMVAFGLAATPGPDRDVLTGGLGADFFDIGHFYDATRSLSVTGVADREDSVTNFRPSQGDLLTLGGRGVGPASSNSRPLILGGVTASATAPLNFALSDLLGGREAVALFLIPNALNAGLPAQDWSAWLVVDLNSNLVVDTQDYTIRLGLPEGNTNLNANWFAQWEFSIVGTQASETLTSNGPGGWIYGFGGNDTLNGAGLADIILGGEGNDLINGAGGFDDLTGEAGDDTLDGGNNDDKLSGGEGADRLIGGAGIDVALYVSALSGVTARMDFSSLNTGDAAGDTYSGIEMLTGSAFDDFLVGDDSGNTIRGGNGRDYVAGVGGADTLYGEDGDDVVDGGAGNDSLFGGNGKDTLIGGAGADTLAGESVNDFASYANATAGVTARLDMPGLNTSDAAGDVYSSIDNLIGSAFFDFLVGNGAGNTIFAGSSFDFVAGVGGSDALHGEDGNDTLDGGAGNDTLFGGTGADSLVGGGGVDAASYALAATGVVARLDFPSLNLNEAEGDSYDGISALVGSGFADQLVGTTGGQTLSGGAGIDTLIGRQGADTYVGGADLDFFFFLAEDFEAGVWDVIKDMNADGAADWFTTTGVDRFAVWALDYQGGVVVSLAGLGFGLTGGGVFIENFSAAQFYNQLLTL